jgi:ABC-type phosphate transport system substrate-binding protein
VDFGSVTGSLAEYNTAKRDSSEDVVQVPVVAYAITVGYNVYPAHHSLPNTRALDGQILTLGTSGMQIPGLVARASLALNLTTLADILLGTVASWNDTAIRELNPTLASFLPRANITLALPGQTPGVMRVLIKSLRAASALFNETVTRRCPNPTLTNISHMRSCVVCVRCVRCVIIRLVIWL